MAEPRASEKVPLTIYLTTDLAVRLKAAAEKQKRAAAELVLDVLDRTLPQAGGQGKNKIPYT
jgi:hypothetical protein